MAVCSNVVSIDVIRRRFIGCNGSILSSSSDDGGDGELFSRRMPDKFKPNNLQNKSLLVLRIESFITCERSASFDNKMVFGRIICFQIWH